MNGKNMAAGTLGLLLASAAGAILGLLFAPKPGSELRQDLTDKANQVAKRMRAKKDELMEEEDDLTR